jgi:hypothetical protein
MRNVGFAVCSHAALTWIQLRQRETIRNGKMESAILNFMIHQPSDSPASHALGRFLSPGRATSRLYSFGPFPQRDSASCACSSLPTCIVNFCAKTSVFQIAHICENMGSEANAGSDLRLASRIGPEKPSYRNVASIELLLVEIRRVSTIQHSF